MNAQPLGGARRWGGGSDGNDGYGSPPSNYAGYSSGPAHGAPYMSGSPSGSAPRDTAMVAAAAAAANIGIKRDRDGASDGVAPAPVDGVARKRKSRWGDAADKVDIPTAIGSNVSAEELDKYAIQVRLDEIARKLRSGDFIPPDRERSPSPPPIYGNEGRRINTREVRYRKKLEDERVSLVDRQLKLDPAFRPPAEYHATKRNQRPTEKVYLPIKEFPEINFFGLLVGPRGNTLKTMERQSGAKISIRGKGSVKEGKGKGGNDDEEEMHCVVNADDEAAVKKCVRLINQVIETAASTPEGDNDHKRSQLRELAALNGTLRDDENQVCKNCGNKGHRAFECPEQRNWTAHIICHRCGGQGHLARDCTQGRVGGPMQGGAPAAPPGGTGNQQFDSEYANLMAELGESNPAAAQAAPPAAARGANGEKIPPWRNPEVWHQPGMQPRGGAGGQRGGRGGYGSPHAQSSHQQYAYQQGGYASGEQQHYGGEQPQQDYSAEWAAYYAAQAAAAAAQEGGVAAADASGQQQADYTKEWEEYYRMQAAAQAQEGKQNA